MILSLSSRHAHKLEVFEEEPAKEQKYVQFNSPDQDQDVVLLIITYDSARWSEVASVAIWGKQFGFQVFLVQGRLPYYG